MRVGDAAAVPPAVRPPMHRTNTRRKAKEMGSEPVHRGTCPRVAKSLSHELEKNINSNRVYRVGGVTRFAVFFETPSRTTMKETKGKVVKKVSFIDLGLIKKRRRQKATGTCQC
ncbi:hypothetical protein EVAR_28356_1 [Eumeta japonica]|uniref:Uncharacterized protein n=1 Tax=Eumeta variegata TaxID=151549 RepID=A0A4C1V949_EUMVA|nr:hypothetical protein EVAR_28356_1 [Eumeta japonica]